MENSPWSLMLSFPHVFISIASSLYQRNPSPELLQNSTDFRFQLFLLCPPFIEDTLAKSYGFSSDLTRNRRWLSPARHCLPFVTYQPFRTTEVQLGRVFGEKMQIQSVVMN